ncbi:MAG: hypothetical protein ACLR13_05875 [Acutalibacteraceae bacterium]
MKRKTEAEAHRLSKLADNCIHLVLYRYCPAVMLLYKIKINKTIKSTAQVCTGQQITVTLSDGVLDCTVDEVKCNE